MTSEGSHRYLSEPGKLESQPATGATSQQIANSSWASRPRKTPGDDSGSEATMRNTLLKVPSGDSASLSPSGTERTSASRAVSSTKLSVGPRESLMICTTGARLVIISD